MQATTALIIGIDGDVGGYLARLLDARGVSVTALAGDTHVIDRLGIGGSLALHDTATLTAAAGSGRFAVIHAINDLTASRSDAIAALFASAAPATRLCHVSSLGDAAESGVRRQSDSIEDWRRQGRAAVNVQLGAHDSRLGRRDSLPARIIATAFGAAQGLRPEKLVISETGPVDWGWTPEYVDAVARVAMAAEPIDRIIGTGHGLSMAEFARHAFGFFKLDPNDHIQINAGDSAAGPPIDALALKAATGWSASTYSGDLVRALCEGAADRG